MKNAIDRNVKSLSSFPLFLLFLGRKATPQNTKEEDNSSTDFFFFSSSLSFTIEQHSY